MTTPVQLIEVESEWSHPYGDLFVNNSKLITKLTEKDFKDVQFLNIHYIATNPIIALEVLPETQGMWKECSKKFMYKDAILKTNSYAFVPLGILSPDISKYLDHYAHPPYWLDMALDQSWVFDERIKEQLIKCEIPRTTNLLLGSGYTDFFSVNDGSWSLEPQYLTLDNGDKIIGVGIVWHNK